MGALSPAEWANWQSLYAATALLAVIGAVLAILSVSVDIHHERLWRELSTFQGVLLFAPRLWWRWQKKYLLATPVILAIILYYAAWLGMF